MTRFSTVFVVAAVFMLMLSCSKRGDKYGQIPPDTFIVFESINLTGDARLTSNVRLSWYGTDEDGFVAGYEISLDNETWSYTTAHDSTFSFDIPAGSDSADITFYVRAVDNDSLRDPDPAFLNVPIKNSPPSAQFSDAALSDVALGAASYEWNYDDPDGRETVTGAFIKINNGDWTPFSRNSQLFSIVPENPNQPGNQNAHLYLGTDNDVHATLNGFVNNDSNTVYIKVIDRAEAESPVDTSKTIFFQQPTSDLLVVGGQPAAVRNVYFDVLNEVYPQYDYLDYSRGDRLPRYWDPTFKLILRNYQKVFFFSGDDLLTNSATNQTGLLLGFAAPSISEFTSAGGRILISTRFNESHDLSSVTGVLAIDELVSGPAASENMRPDSFLIPASPLLPELKPQNVVFGMNPFVPSADASVFYRAQFNNHPQWPRNTIAAARTGGDGKINEVLFNTELYRFTGNTDKLEQLFDELYNDVFER